MSRDLQQCVVVFGGFRTTTLVGSRAVATLLNVLGVDEASHENVWNGRGDSLTQRYRRSANWLSSRAQGPVELHVLGHSMGCQLTVKFAHLADMAAAAEWRLGQLILTAPDPKYRRGTWDLKEEQAGETPAYDEASTLWAIDGAAGPHFTDTLGLVSGSFRGGCRVVFCKGDAVAEWHQNVEIMRSGLDSCSAIKWIEALHDAVVNLNGIRISLEPDEIALSKPLINFTKSYGVVRKCIRSSNRSPQADDRSGIQKLTLEVGSPSGRLGSILAFYLTGFRQRQTSGFG